MTYIIKVSYLILTLIFCFSAGVTAAKSVVEGKTSNPVLQNTTVYNLARAPQMSKTALVKIWQPYVDYLIEKTRIRFQLMLFDSRKEFELQLLNGSLDLVYMNPYYTLVAHEKHGYVPLVRSGKIKLKGILVVRKDSDIKTIKDLNNKIISFPWPNAFGASLYMRAILIEKERLKINPNYVQTHDNVYRSVVNGQSVAGGGVNRTFARQPVNLKDNLRILYTTPGVAPHPLSAHPRVPDFVRKAIIDATLDLDNSKEGKKLLKKLKLSKPIKAIFEKDYKILKKLNLTKFATLKE